MHSGAVNELYFASEQSPRLPGNFIASLADFIASLAFSSFLNLLWLDWYFLIFNIYKKGITHTLFYLLIFIIGNRYVPIQNFPIVETILHTRIFYGIPDTINASYISCAHDTFLQLNKSWPRWSADKALVCWYKVCCVVPWLCHAR